MIGKITFTIAGEQESAVLNDRGVWQSNDQDIAGMLNQLYDPRRNYSPAHGVFGHLELYRAAATLKGKVQGIKPFKPDTDEERIY